MLFYTGVGSRETPIEILDMMQQLGTLFAKKGYTLRSGGASGADSAFEAGCDIAKGPKEIYIPWPGFNDRREANLLIPTSFKNWTRALDILEPVHPAFSRLTQGAKKLHGRNVYQVLGKDLNTPSRVLIAWTPGGKLAGGTATAIKLAMKYNVSRIINLGKEEDLKLMKEYLDKSRKE